MTETLSDKIMDITLFTPTTTGKLKEVLNSGDVKEAVQKLKEELADPKLNCWKPNQIIDKIFGDKLI